VISITSKEELREDMVLANDKQKDLLKKRTSLLESERPEDKESALKITHEIAKLEDFIRSAENTLRMSD
jgi:hypothetical protein